MADVTIVNAVHSHDPRVPLGPLYLCSFLEANGYEVDFRDYQVCDGAHVGSPDQFVSWLEGAAPILAVSTLSSSLPLVLAALRRSRLRGAVDTVILGGAGVGNLGPAILRHFPEVDVVVDGEGELTLLEIVDRIRLGGPLSAVPGVTCREGHEIRTTGRRPRLDVLDELPFPAYHHIDLDDYTSRTAFDRIPLAVLSARGCPHSCSFCDIPGVWPGGIRYRSVSDVIAEIELLEREHGLPRFHVADDTFVQNRDRVLEFCDALEEHELVMPWSCLGRVDRIDEELLGRLTEVGCDTIFYGIESGSDRILSKIGKGFSVSEAMDAVELSLRFMRTHVSFIWGFPFESLEDLYDTVIALLGMHRMGADPHLNLLAPLPSARLIQQYRDQLTDQLASEIGWDWALMENYEYGEELRGLIRKHPDIFAPFFCFDSPGFDKKVRLLESWGLGLGQPSPSPSSPGPGTGPQRADADERRSLPGIRPEVVLRRVGGRDYILDTVDCLLFEPNPAHVEVFKACERGSDLGSLVDHVARASKMPAPAASAFIAHALETFRARALLDSRYEA